MDKGWQELESDPGLFTLLLEDFGVHGVQVEEIYDLQKPIEGPVYGFIFLFKWIEERRSRRKIIQEDESFVVDEDIVNSMFFAQQVIPNSCATHALLSVLLNCDKLKLGDTLEKLKQFTHGMNTQDKGYAIGNVPELARAHNSHARPDPMRRPEHQKGLSAVRTMEAFHFVSYVSINGRLFELDGLKPYPIDHGPWAENEEWTEKFRRVISERLGMATGGVPYHDIRFNLMAVVPDRRQQYEYKLNTLKTNRQIVLEALQQVRTFKPVEMVKVTSPEIVDHTPGRGRAKAEPIVTRSVAAREALANQTPTSPPSVRTRHKQKQAAAAAAAQSGSGTGSSSSAAPSSVGSRATTPSPVLGRLPPGLDCHSYAKSPILKDPNSDESQSGGKLDGYEADRGESDGELEGGEVGGTGSAGLGVGGGGGGPGGGGGTSHSMQGNVNLGDIHGDQLTTVKDNAVKIEISVSDEKEGSVHMPTTVATTDVTKPLMIQTKFATSPGPSSESTDTASEVGSGMNSPVCSSTLSGQSSPNFPRSKIRGEEAIKAAEGLLLQHKLETGGQLFGGDAEGDGSTGGDLQSVKVPPGEGESELEASPRSKFCSQQGFTPKDLLALLKNVENEIIQTESFLKDECEKRKKYKIDDCRRTHNYDQFVCTFLSMLAEQGHLAGLVEQHMSIKRRPSLGISHLHKMRKPDKKKRPRPKKKR